MRSSELLFDSQHMSQRFDKPKPQRHSQQSLLSVPRQVLVLFGEWEEDLLERWLGVQEAVEGAGSNGGHFGGGICGDLYGERAGRACKCCCVRVGRKTKRGEVQNEFGTFFYFCLRAIGQQLGCPIGLGST